MTRKSLEFYYSAALAAILFLIWLHAPIAVGFSSLFPASEQYIKAWKEILLFVLFLVAIYLVTRHKLWKQLLNNRILQLVLGLAALHFVIAALLFDGWDATIAGLMIDLRFLLAFALTFVAVKLYPRARKMLVVASAAGGAVAILFGLMQITFLPDDILRGLGYSKETITAYTTIDKNPDFVRIQSTLRGPNPLGALCVLLLAGTLAFVLARWQQLSRNYKLTGGATVLAIIAVLFATYSRSAYLAAAIATLLVVGLHYRSKITWKVATAVIVASAVSLVALAQMQHTDWYKNVVLHEDPDSSTVIKSNDQHVESLATGLERLVSQPWGAGVGSTGSASIISKQTPNVTIENYYLFVAHEVGWLGFVGFIVLVGLVLHELWRRAAKDWAATALFASGVGLSIAALLLPVWADDTTAIVWWGLAGAVLASSPLIHKRKP